MQALPILRKELMMLKYKAESTTGSNLELADFDQMVTIVNAGLTIRSVSEARLDLLGHLYGAHVELLRGEHGSVLGFGIYKQLSTEFLDFSFMVAPHARSQGSVSIWQK
jgi:hypothetical protein